MEHIVAAVCFGSLLGIVGTIFFISAMRLFRKVYHILSTPTSRVGELKRNPLAYLNKQVELTGYANCEQHLIAPYSELPCIYHFSQNEDHIRYVSRRRKGGNRTRYYYKVKDKIVSNQKFFVQDQSERIEIDPIYFEVEGKKSFREYVPVGKQSSVKFDVLMTHRAPGETVVGNLRTEQILPPMKKVYVIGMLARQNNKLCIVGKEKKEGKTAIISLGSEQEVLFWNFLYFLGNLLVALAFYAVAAVVVYIYLKEGIS